MRSTYKIASLMSRRSCSGGRPKARALPRRSKRHAARTGSFNSQRASDRSLGYGRRFGGMFPAYRAGPNAPRRTTMTTEAHDREDRASWDETGVRSLPAHLQPHPARRYRPPQQPRLYRNSTLRESTHRRADKTKTTSKWAFWPSSVPWAMCSRNRSPAWQEDRRRQRCTDGFPGRAGCVGSLAVMPVGSLRSRPTARP